MDIILFSKSKNFLSEVLINTQMKEASNKSIYTQNEEAAKYSHQAARRTCLSA